MDFFLEGSLRGLNKWLRFMGYNTKVCEGKITKEVIFQNKEKIFLITSPETAKMIKRLGIKYLLLPRENLQAQLFIVVNKLNLPPRLTLDICSLCGEKLVPVKKEDFKNQIPLKVYQNIEEYNYCVKCKKLYWEGDHVKRLKEKFKKFLFLNVQSKA